MGTGDVQNRIVPQIVDIGNLISGHVTSVTCGFSHTVVVGSHGDVWSTGENQQGQLGQNHRLNQSTFTRIERMDPAVVMAAAGSAHTVLLTRDGDVFTFGSGLYGELKISS